MHKTLINAINLLKNVVTHEGTPEEITKAASYLTACDECANIHDRSYDDNKIRILVEKYCDEGTPNLNALNGAKRYKIGDVIDFTLNDGEEVSAMAVRQDTDGMVFIFVDCLAKEYSMNDNNINEGGYENSDLRWRLNSEILDRLPSEIKNSLVKFDNGDYLRLPTEKEIFGENPYGENEPKTVAQFEPMKLRRNRIAFQGKEGDWEWYWLQNSVKGSAPHFARVSSLGYANSTGASTSLGVRPCLKIKS